MKKLIIKLGSFAGVFLLSLIFFSLFMNKGNTDMTAEMAEASLPLVSVMLGDYEVNLMHGYLQEMDEGSMRETITPMGENREIEIKVDLFGQTVDGMSFEIRSLDGNRLVENTEITDYTQQEDTITAKFAPKDLMTPGEEYNLILILTLEEDREVRYYTRVIQADYDMQEKLNFINDFHLATFDSEMVSELSRYLEPDSEADNTTLSKVTIHSSLNQLGWGGMEVKRETEPVISIKEAAPQTASVILEYLVSYPADGRTAYAAVEEYFRVRYTADRNYLLDYERTMNQYLEEKASSFRTDGINLGITDADVEKMESDDGNVVAFTHCGTLYTYHCAEQKFARLFSFYRDSYLDLRETYNNHDFKILQTDESGNVTFLVYGYMNRGRHEGESGIMVCHYGSTLNTVEELAFIPWDKSADILRADIENLSYINTKNDLFLMLDGNIYHINLDSQSCEIIAQNLTEDSYRVSEDNHMVSWQKQNEKYSSSSLVLMNLNSGKVTEIAAPEGNYIMPLGFMGDDLIYGIAMEDSLARDEAGEIIFPMHTVYIQNENGTVLIEYHRDNIYVTGCRIENNQIALERVERNGNTYSVCEEDQIVNNEKELTRKNSIVQETTQDREKIVILQVKEEVDPQKVKLQTPREVLFEGSRNIEIPQQKEKPIRYYVYGKNGVVDIYSSPGKAIEQAYQEAGSVTMDGGTYVFKRDRLHTSNQIMAITGEKAEGQRDSLEICLDSMMSFAAASVSSGSMLDQGKSVLEILEENLRDSQVLDLKGCSLEAVLYYPDREIPVLAILGDGSAVLITGFNEQNVVLMDPSTGTVYKKGRNDSAQWFEENGNRFITYVNTSQ